MRRVPDLYPKVFDDPAAAREYAASAAKRNARIARSFVAALERAGFAGGRVLDAGTGAGDIAVALARAFPRAEVVGLDLSEPLLELARASAETASLHGRVSFKRGDVQDMPFEDDSFDVVVSLNTWHVIDDPVAMLNEAERVLAPSGIAMIADIRRCWLGHLIPAFKTAYTPAEAVELVQRSTLRPWRIHDLLLSFTIVTGEL